jgi:hypothetical protein
VKFLTRRRTQEGDLRQQYTRLVKAGAVSDLSASDESRLDALMAQLSITTDQLAADVEAARNEQAVLARARELTPLAESVPAKEAAWRKATLARIDCEANAYGEHARANMKLKLHGQMLPLPNDEGNALVAHRESVVAKTIAGPVVELAKVQDAAHRELAAAKGAANELNAMRSAHPALFPAAVSSH